MSLSDTFLAAALSLILLFTVAPAARGQPGVPRGRPGTRALDLQKYYGDMQAPRHLSGTSGQ
jgi:hypothetical protein